MNMILTLILILSIAPTTTTYAQAILLPDIGDPSSVYFAADEERKLGLEIMRRLRERGAVVEDVQMVGLGIRGIGTLYYLSYALNQGFFDEVDAVKLWIVCSIVILASIFIHGLISPRLLKLTPNKPRHG